MQINLGALQIELASLFVALRYDKRNKRFLIPTFVDWVHSTREAHVAGSFKWDIGKDNNGKKTLIFKQ